MKNKLLLVMEAALPRMKQYLADNEALIEAGRLAGVPFWGKPPGFEREFLAVFMHINIRSGARALTSHIQCQKFIPYSYLYNIAGNLLFWL